eukprot:11332201-Heterocapsa_arctica.AAC.1
MAASNRVGLPEEHGCDVKEEDVEVHYKGNATKLIHQRPRAPKPDEVLVQRIYVSGVRRAVVQRDDDSLTAEELRTHAKEVASSMLSELKTWANINSFSRRRRATARNIID